MNILKKILEELIGLNESEWLALKTKFNKKEYKSKSFLISEDKIAYNLYYIQSGLLRTFHLQEGKEINTYFACDNQFITSFSSFITQTHSFEYLQTVEDSTVYSISYVELIELYNESSKFEKLGRILAEKNYLCVLDRTLSMQTKNAKEKYLDFIENYDKKIVQRIPQHQIASFLGIAPESLSRVRKEISIS